jgi:hypothetical protein
MTNKYHREAERLANRIEEGVNEIDEAHAPFDGHHAETTVTDINRHMVKQIREQGGTILLALPRGDTIDLYIGVSR